MSGGLMKPKILIDKNEPTAIRTLEPVTTYAWVLYKGSQQGQKGKKPRRASIFSGS